MKNINNEMDWNVFVVFSLFIVTYFGNLKLFQAFNGRSVVFVAFRKC